MQWTIPKIKSLLLVAMLAVIGTFIQNQQAKAFDIDCKVILCLAGGFPSGCGDAYSYMIDRITDTPPKPPFGFCAMSDGSEYQAHNVNYRFLGSGPEAYVCDDDKILFYRRDDEFRGFGQETAFCYTHISSGRLSLTRDGDEFDTRVFENQSPAQRVNLELNIVIEPGTDHEYRSPLFRINTATGYVNQRPL